jgi:poly-gamma-glutamate synthesis protein (capsule biosynthesis protein)
MPNDAFSLFAVGDVAPLREHPEEVFEFTADALRTADITFGQLERVLTRRGTVQLAMAPGVRADPKLAKVLADVGFDVMSAASNHALDFSDEGLFDTLEAMSSNNVPVIGAGRNIEEARKPVIIERNSTKVGFLGYCSVVPKGFEAGPNRPGVAPIRATTAYEQVDWQPGAPPRILSKAHPEDLAAMVEDIEKLRPRVDVLVVSMHWGVHFVPAVIAMYQREVGHAAIDAGADLILGHHAHILKGIEVYKAKAIFFSLCNFSADWSPQRVVQTHLYDFYHWEIDPEYTTCGFSVDAQKTILVKCAIADKKIQRVAFQPVWINKKVQPQLLSRTDPRSDRVFDYMQWLCRDQRLDTLFSRDGDDIVVLT